MNYFLYELKRTMFSRKVSIAIILTFIFMIIGGAEYIFNNYFDINAVYLYKYAYSDGTISLFVFAAPIIACIPFATSYIEERESNFLKYIYIKITPLKYAIIKVIINSFLGGVVLLFGLGSFLILCIVLKGVDSTGMITLNNSISNIYSGSPLAYILIELLQTFVFGAVFATICLAISTFTNNKYLAVVFTFFLYMVIGVITSNNFPYLNIQILYDLSLYPEIGVFYRYIYALCIFIVSIITIGIRICMEDK